MEATALGFQNVDVSELAPGPPDEVEPKFSLALVALNAPVKIGVFPISTMLKSFLSLGITICAATFVALWIIEKDEPDLEHELTPLIVDSIESHERCRELVALTASCCVAVDVTKLHKSSPLTAIIEAARGTWEIHLPVDAKLVPYELTRLLCCRPHRDSFRGIIVARANGWIYYLTYDLLENSKRVQLWAACATHCPQPTAIKPRCKSFVPLVATIPDHLHYHELLYQPDDLPQGRDLPATRAYVPALWPSSQRTIWKVAGYSFARGRRLPFYHRQLVERGATLKDPTPALITLGLASQETREAYSLIVDLPFPDLGRTVAWLAGDWDGPPLFPTFAGRPDLERQYRWASREFALNQVWNRQQVDLANPEWRGQGWEINRSQLKAVDPGSVVTATVTLWIFLRMIKNPTRLLSLPSSFHARVNVLDFSCCTGYQPETVLGLNDRLRLRDGLKPGQLDCYANMTNRTVMVQIGYHDNGDILGWAMNQYTVAQLALTTAHGNKAFVPTMPVVVGHLWTTRYPDHFVSWPGSYDVITDLRIGPNWFSPRNAFIIVPDTHVIGDLSEVTKFGGFTRRIDWTRRENCGHALSPLDNGVCPACTQYDSLYDFWLDRDASRYKVQLLQIPDNVAAFGLYTRGDMLPQFLLDWAQAFMGYVDDRENPNPLNDHEWSFTQPNRRNDQSQLPLQLDPVIVERVVEKIVVERVEVTKPCTQEHLTDHTCPVSTMTACDKTHHTPGLDCMTRCALCNGTVPPANAIDNLWVASMDTVLASRAAWLAYAVQADLMVRGVKISGEGLLCAYRVVKHIYPSVTELELQTYFVSKQRAPDDPTVEVFDLFDYFCHKRDKIVWIFSIKEDSTNAATSHYWPDVVVLYDNLHFDIWERDGHDILRDYTRWLLFDTVATLNPERPLGDLGTRDLIVSWPHNTAILTTWKEEEKVEFLANWLPSLDPLSVLEHASITLGPMMHVPDDRKIVCGNLHIRFSQHWNMTNAPVVNQAMATRIMSLLGPATRQERVANGHTIILRSLPQDIGKIGANDLEIIAHKQGLCVVPRDYVGPI